MERGNRAGDFRGVFVRNSDVSYVKATPKEKLGHRNRTLPFPGKFTFFGPCFLQPEVVILSAYHLWLKSQSIKVLGSVPADSP